ncbi:hypothetical protein MSAN_01562300 [Mycena sanguinolenta]|uniref:Uncharacterized protein n=1 Tax=Mycena sanguinolenta TaxID=230812 RepID=A0A8H6Y123_9AGAR|nr:hypothetical protein MSAN_01562300 [Mycena sanguinolenta]
MPVPSLCGSPEPELDVTAPRISDGYHNHGHVLSTKSKALQRDTFFFAPSAMHPTDLVLGFNQKLTPLSMAKLKRWVHLMSGKENIEFYVCPVTMERRGIMSYGISPSGPIVESSIEPLPSGNYGWYGNRTLKMSGLVDLTGIDPAMRNWSFEYNATVMEEQRLLDDQWHWQKLVDLYTFPSDVEQAVLSRDIQRCRLTQTTTDVMSTWIVPPPWAWATVKARDVEDLDSAPFIVPANAFVLHKDLKVHFYNHNFAVDADEDYRIVVFRDMGDDQALLPTHLPRGSEHDDADAQFFRLHLRYSLNFMVLGGDVSETYPPSRILHLMYELGAGAQDAEMVSLSDSRWQSELGQAILADELEARASSLSNSDDSSLDDSESSPVDDSLEFDNSFPVIYWADNDARAADTVSTRALEQDEEGDFVIVT